MIPIEGDGLTGISITDNENPPKISTELRSKNLTPIYESYFSATKDGYIFEQALTNSDERCNSRHITDEQCKIITVVRSELRKDSQTWSDPVITTDAKIFELGKTIYQQSFIARPISINGKKIEANFPPQTDKKR